MQPITYLDGIRATSSLLRNDGVGILLAGEQERGHSRWDSGGDFCNQVFGYKLIECHTREPTSGLNWPALEKMRVTSLIGFRLHSRLTVIEPDGSSILKTGGSECTVNYFISYLL